LAEYNQALGLKRIRTAVDTLVSTLETHAPSYLQAEHYYHVLYSKALLLASDPNDDAAYDAMVDAVEALEDIEPASGTATPEEQKPPTRPEAPAIDYDTVANKLAAQSKGKQAALVRFMRDKDAAELQDVADRVHGDAHASEDAMGKNAERTSESLAEMGCPLSFRVAGGMMHKTISPE
jgi:hypothetical protein